MHRTGLVAGLLIPLALLLAGCGLQMARPHPGHVTASSGNSGKRPSPRTDATSMPGGTRAKRAPYDWFGPVLLPTHRIVAYYGNPESPAMGVLGSRPTSKMVTELEAQASAYEALDPSHPVIEALDMVTVVASSSPEPSGTYSVTMGRAAILRELDVARAHRMLLILDLQVGKGTVQADVRALEPFLAQPDVELALDPEFDMNSKPGGIPGRNFGSMTAREVNWALWYLNRLVVRDHLPQKVLIVHQFMVSMLPDWQDIHSVAHVALVRDQDGVAHDAYGDSVKVANYETFVRDEPVACTLGLGPTPPFSPTHLPDGAQIAAWQKALGQVQVCGGFKVFYTRDTNPMDPAEVMGLTPPPLVVIYQ